MKIVAVISFASLVWFRPVLGSLSVIPIGRICAPGLAVPCPSPVRGFDPL